MIYYSYRAKPSYNIYTSEWVYGYVTKLGMKSCNGIPRFGIIQDNAIPVGDGSNYTVNITEVDPITICPTFCYKDDSGATIYDKDIVEFKHEDSKVINSAGQETHTGVTERYLIQWLDEEQRFVALQLVKGDTIYGTPGSYLYSCERGFANMDSLFLMLIDAYGDFQNTYGGHIRIIGNAFDNSDLIYQ